MTRGVNMLVKSQKIIVYFGLWAMATLAALTLLGKLDYLSVYALYLLGLVVIVHIPSPYAMKPSWRVRLDGIFMAGIAIYVFLMLNQAILTILKLKL
jgi:hypothetical protein